MADHEKAMATMSDSDYRKAVVGTLRTIALLLLALLFVSVLSLSRLYDLPT